MTASEAAPRRALVTTGLGVTQILSWGSSYYLLAVLAGPVARDTGWPLGGVVSGLSVGLLAGGLASPWVGRAVHRCGGRPVLAAGSGLLALGLTGLAAAPSLAAFLLAWAVIGAGMAAALYDAAFGAVGRLYGKDARRAVTALTLWGGFASTLAWPLSAWLVGAVGWRGACLAYAALHLVVALPIHLLVLPREARAEAAQAARGPAPPPPRAETRAFALLAAIQTLAALVASTLSVHLLALFERQGLSAAQAVALGALIGPAQVAARVVEMASGRRAPPLALMGLSLGLIGAGVALLALRLPLPGLALLLYGAGNGLFTIARGAVPLVLFDPARYAIVLGRLALPSLIVQAAAPTAGAWLLVGDGTGLLAVLAVAMVAALGLWLALVSESVRRGVMRP